MRRGNPDQDYGLHKLIHSFIDEQPGLRARDIAATDIIMQYVVEHGYSINTVQSYISSMWTSDLLERKKVDGVHGAIYRVKRPFDKRILQKLDAYYKSHRSTEGWDAAAEWELLGAGNVDLELAALIKKYGAADVCKAIPQAIALAQ